MKIVLRVVIKLMCVVGLMPYIHASMVPLPQRNDYPFAVSFMVVDLKYDTNCLKVCEFGEGCLSGFVGHEKLYGPGKIWASWWSFLHRFRKPILFIAPAAKVNSFETLRKRYQKNNKDSLAMYALFAGDGICAPTLQEAIKELSATKPHSSETQAIAVKLAPQVLFKQYDMLADDGEGIAVVDYATQPFALNKLFMHALFVNDPLVGHYRPACCVLDKGAVVGAVEDIKRTMPADAYVIKPINAWKGRGIAICASDDLASTSERLFATAPLDRASKVWRAKQEVLIESLEHSMPVAAKDKFYDATMRVAVGLVYEKGKVTMKVLGAYWKLPDAALGDQDSLRKTFLSHITKSDVISSAEVDAKTLFAVERELRVFMPHVFKKMVALKSHKVPLSELRFIIDGTADEDLHARLALL